MKNTLLVGYGTLLYRASLGHTIGVEHAAKREMRPVLVKGFQRLFNLRPADYGTSAVLGERGIERLRAGQAFSTLLSRARSARLSSPPRRTHPAGCWR